MFIKDISGGLCAVNGVKVAGSRKGKYGVAIIDCPNSVASAVFTTNIQKKLLKMVKYLLFLLIVEMQIVLQANKELKTVNI